MITPTPAMRRVDLYHFTPLENAVSIVATGAMLPNRHLLRTKVDFEDIGDADIKASRDARPVPTWVGRGLCVGDCVPWYVAMHPPMYWVVKSHARELVYIETCADTLSSHGLTLVCANGNARAGDTEFSPARNSADIRNLVNVRWLEGGNLDRHELADPELKRKFQAEILVPDRVPVRAIKRITTRRSPAARAIEAHAKIHGHPVTVVVDPNYFPTEGY